jgi:hypothetical protein
MKGVLRTMFPTEKNTSLPHYRKKLRILLLIFALLLIVGIVSAAVLTMYYTTNTATVKTADVRLVAGPDSTASPTEYPNATVTVDSTNDSATVAFSLFPSVTNTPQPATYYTNLLQIKNVGTASHTINSITISGITGAANLGSLTIYYYDTQTDTPDTGTPVASTTLTSSSTGTISLLSAQVIPPSDTDYIEIVGYAAPDATAGSTVTFNLSIQWV